MSARHERALERASANIKNVLEKVAVGTAARPRKITKYELALEHADAWAADQPPKSDERGGSSSPREASDRREEAGVKRRSALAASRLTKNALAIEGMLDEMYRDVIFLTALTEDTPDEEAGELPGCRSCARVDAFEPVWERLPAAKAAGLCRFCWGYGEEGQPPPKPLVELKHRGTRRELSTWLAKNLPDHSRAETDETPPCGTVWTHLGRDHTCHRARDHEGDCAGVGVNGERVTWTMSVVPS